MTYLRNLDEIGAGISGRAITDTLYVSPNGSGVDGKTWATAYTTIQAALDAASTDADDCTQICISPHATYYNINTTGNPTWTGNYVLIGPYRKWAPIRNSHASATAIMKFTGKVAVKDLAISQSGAVDGLIFTGSGARVIRCGFNSESVTGACSSIILDGSAALTNGAILEDIQFLGHVSYTTALDINTSRVNEFRNLYMHACLDGIKIAGATSDYNVFNKINIGDCAIGINIDAGGHQHFNGITFHDNTKNVDDEVGDSVWTDIHGEFPVIIEPDNFTGVTVSTHANADTWGSDTEIRAAATAPEKPFKIVAILTEASAAEKFRLRLSADSGTSHFYDIMTEGEVNKTKSQSSQASDFTDFIFNKGTRISGSSKSESGGNSLVVWLKLEEI